ncbi:hypothetical protein SNEBB_010932 [Seison nebaliae]|nr:hypothetical protein SNEBB_010932 [Seison nebaliae]
MKNDNIKKKNLEREIETRLRINRFDIRGLLKHAETYQRFQILQMEDRNNFKTDHNNIKENLNKIKKHLKTNGKISELTTLKVLAERIEESLSELKEKQTKSLTILDMDGKHLMDEIKNFECSLNKEEDTSDIYLPRRTVSARPSNKNNVKRTSLTSAPQMIEENASLCKEVIKFDNFVRKNGGTTGGWTSEDHQIFMRIYNKYLTKNKSKKMMEELYEIFTEKTKSQVDQHFQWYQQYFVLLVEKKAAIIEWKNKKKNYHEKKVIRQLNETDLENIREKKAKMKKKNKSTRKETLKKLQRWKFEKELEDNQNEQQSKIRKLKEEHKRKVMEAVENERKKIMLEQYRLKKDLVMKQKEYEDNLKMDKRKKSVREQKELERIFFEKNHAYIEEKSAKFNKYKKEEEEQRKEIEKFIERLKPAVPLDKTRVLKETVVSKKRNEAVSRRQRQYKFQQKSSERPVSSMNYIPYNGHRAVPSWRT